MIEYLLPYNLCIYFYCVTGFCFSWYLKKEFYLADFLTIFIVTIIFSKQFNVLISLSSGVCTFILCFYRDNYTLWLRRKINL